MRWCRNIGLLYLVLVATGLALGLVGAVGGDAAVRGYDVTIIHQPHPAHDPPGTEPTVSKQGTGPQPELLVFYPLLALFWGTLIAAPLALVGLAIAEFLSFGGVPTRVLRWIGIVLAGLLSVSLLAEDDGALNAMIPVGMLAYAAFVRYRPARQRASAKPPQRAVTRSTRAV